MMTSAETWAILGGALGASLLGSLHCAGMCGPLAIVACGGRGEPSRTAALTCEGRPVEGVRGACARGRSHADQVIYHVSRGVAYAIIGAAAGTLGSLATMTDVVAATQRIATIAAGAVLILVGAGMLWTWSGLRARLPGAPTRLRALLTRWHAWALSLPPTRRALMLGLGSPLLPCGWLWAFVAFAATTGSPLTGSAVMIAFWIGSVPALVATVIGARLLLTRLGAAVVLRWMRPAVGVALVALGLHLAITRASIADAVMAAVTRPARADAGERAPSLSDVASETPACCRRPEEPAAADGAPITAPGGDTAP